MWIIPILVCVFGLVFAFLPAGPLDDEMPAPAAVEPKKQLVPAAVVAAAAMLVVSALLIVTL